MKKLFLTVGAVLIMAAQLFGTAAVSGKLLNPNTTGPIIGGYAQFDLINCGGNFPQVAGASISTTQRFLLAADGSWSGALYRNDEIQCNGQQTTLWRLTYFVSSLQVGPQRTFVCAQTTCVFDGIGGLTPTNTTPAPPAPQPPTTGARTFLCSFITPSSTWTCIHNMGTQFVDTEFFDSNFKQIFPDSNTATDVNTVTSTFLQPQSGYLLVINSGNFTPTQATPNFLVSNPSAPQTITGNQPLNVTGPTTVLNNTLTVTGDNATSLGGSLSAKRIEQDRYADQFANIQAAITDAGTTGMVEIPPSVSLTDSYQNNNNLPVLDWRGGIEGPRVWSQIGTSHNVKDPTGVVIPDGNDIVLVSRGAADVHLKNIPEDVTSTTTVVGAGTVTITVSNCNTAAGGNWYAGAGLNVEPPPGASSNYEFIASGSWSCLSSTQLSATFAKAHTQPFHIRQQGVLFLDGYAMKPSPDPGSVLQFYSIADANGNVAIYLPLTNGAFPANAPSLSAVFTGANSTNNNINFRNSGASSQFLLSNSANTFNLVSIDDNGNDIRNGTAGGLFIKNSGTQVCALQNSGGTGLMTCDIWRMNGTTASVGNIRFTSGGAFNFRNNANGADVNGVSKNTTDVVLLGGSAGIGLSAGNMLLSPTAPTIAAAGCGGSAASIPNQNGTAAFEVNVGTTPTSSCTVTMPAAAHNWAGCTANDVTNPTTGGGYNVKLTSGTTTTAVFTFYSTAGAATAPTASDVVRVGGCMAY